MSNEISSLHPIDVYVGSKLREHRKKMNLSQARLAECLNISHQLIQKYEQGVTRISVSTLYDISRIIGVSPGFFYDGFQDHENLQESSHRRDTITMQRPSNFHILLVEDSPADELLTKRCLESISPELTLKCHTTYDGIEALRFLRGQHSTSTPFKIPDLILLDLNIPKKQGLEVLKELKNDRSLKHIPVVVMTHSINASEMQEAYRLHASGYIRKSFDLNQFTKDIHNLIEYWFNTVIISTNY